MNQKCLKLIIAVLVIAFLALLGNYYLRQNSQNVPQTKNQNLLICDQIKEGNILSSKEEHGVVKDIRKRNPSIIGFYTTRVNPNLKETYRNLEQAIQYGWGDYYDFIEGYVPPTPLYGLKERFNDGDLIKIEVDRKKESTVQKGALWVLKAEKLPYPTRDEFIAQAEIAFNSRKDAIFKCADATKNGFPSFRDGIRTSYINWDRDRNIALVSYYGQKEIQGGLQIITVDIVLDQTGTPSAIYVDSRFTMLML